MKAVLCKKWGSPDDLVLEDIESPVPKEDEVLIAVKAVGLNFPDIMMVAGRYQAKPPFPFVPGGEIAGYVIALGENVRHLKVGDRVSALCGTGGLAEEVCTSSSNVFLVPPGIDFVTASSLMVAYGLAYLGLKYRASIKSFDTLLVHGAGGGLGLAAVNMGAALGAKVIANSSSAEKLEIAREQGAQHLINYTQENFVEKVKEYTQDRGANIIYDPVGGDLFDKSLYCVAWEGKILVIGFASGRIPEISVNRLLLNNLSLYGVFLGAYKYHKSELIQIAIPQIIQWAEEGKISPYVSKTYPLDKAADALIALGKGEVIGKVVVKVD